MSYYRRAYRANAARRGPLRISASVAAFLLVFLSQWSWAGNGGVPLPERKPEAPARASAVSDPGAIISVSLGNILKKTGDRPQAAPAPVPAPAPAPLADSDFSQPLSKDDARLYRAAFEAQRKGDMKAADAALAQVGDGRLMGHVLLQRYLHPSAYRSSFEELRDWLERYADHPGADRIYRLATAKMPEGYKGALAKPESAPEIPRVAEPTMHKAKSYGNAAASQRINTLVRAGKMRDALAEIESDLSGGRIDATQYDILRAEIAAAYLYGGNPEKAWPLAAQSARKSARYAPKAGWVAGLIAWREKKYAEAARYFESAAHSPYASGWTQASAAYWAARAHMRLGNVTEVSTWLKRGAVYPRTFYGLISTRALGQDFDFNWNTPTFTRGYRNVLLSIPAANRAMALVDSGQEMPAQAELLRFNPKDGEQRSALLAYATYANLPGLGMRIASAFSESGEIHDAALYPLIPWQPHDGYRLDPALAHAIMRRESRFDPAAESTSGAKGLMQIIPSTARRITKGQPADLEDPGANLALGQRYLEILLADGSVRGDLFSLLIAYNAGPGNLAKWKKRWPDVTDPLLFIELLPSAETRSYVEYVLANYWIYRLREGMPLPSLDAIAAGRPAHYTETD